MVLDENSARLVAEMNRYYDARAPWHDDYMSYESPEKMETDLRPIIEVIESTITGARVLEIACGTGNWTHVLANRAASVVATDNSPGSLALARQKLDGISNVSFMPCDAYSLTEVAGQFDVLFAADWWSHVPKAALRQFLSNVVDKLEPNGIAIFVDMTYKPYFRQEHSYLDADNNRLFNRTLPDGSDHVVVKNFPDRAELESVFSVVKGRLDHRVFKALERWLVIFTLE